MSNGYVIHEDTHRVIIATGFSTPSDNRKTGDMIQIWILCKAVDPVEAITQGLDRLICGNCVHRGINGSGRSCYVNVGQAPLGIWRAWRAGKYPTLQFMDIFSGRKVRFGAYGDPTHLPLSLALAIAGVASGHTGYTHQWARADFVVSDWAGMVMASVDNPAEYAAAKALGMRTFRVAQDDEKAATEARCPASKEMGQRTTCNECLLCSGTSKRARDIVIIDHAIGHKRRVIRIAAAA